MSLWLLLAICLALYLALVGLLLIFGRRTDARALAGFVPDCIRMIRRLVAAPETSGAQRLALLGLIGYLALPFDLIPDFIPVAGVLDDAILVALALRWLVRSRGEEAIREAWPGPESSLNVVLGLVGRRA
jgi:uncharacterized membrane protein YkvA (DUF1232 family)